MNIYMICFTPGGEKTLGKILDRIAGWPADATRVFSYALGSYREKDFKSFEAGVGEKELDGTKVLPDQRIVSWEGRLSEWMKETILNADAYVFVGAAGIAVRAIASYVADKTRDPAVVVIDEKGQFVIPLLSGHIGGANALADQIAADLGAQPVLTTATDVRGLFAVDVFAKNNHLRISDMKQAKKISAALLRGEKVGFFSELPWEGVLPTELIESKEDDLVYGIVISEDKDRQVYDEQLLLMPQNLTIGIGCRKGIPKEQILKAVESVLRDNGLSTQAICRIASIDLKKDEAGLIETAAEYGVPFETFTAEALAEVEGDFSESSFVKGITGVDNVCERAAVLASGGLIFEDKTADRLKSGGKLVVRKTAADGVTVAVVIEAVTVCF